MCVFFTDRQCFDQWIWIYPVLLMFSTQNKKTIYTIKWNWKCSANEREKLLLKQMLLTDTVSHWHLSLVSFPSWKTHCQRHWNKSNAKNSSSLGGLEPPTFRLTAERANRLRHRDMSVVGGRGLHIHHDFTCVLRE